MIILRDGDVTPEDATAVAIGVFDGLHLGHQKVIAALLAIADRHQVASTLITFDPHPAHILARDHAPLLLETLDQRLEGLALLGVERVRILTFDQTLAHESATSFIERVLVGELHVVDLIVGRDFRFGHDRLGDVSLLEFESARHGFRVHPSPIYGAATRWSSTNVREALRAGDVALATATLGRPFTLRGFVGHGDARGGALGYATANLVLNVDQQIPQIGIYAGAARTTDRIWRPAAISVGTRPQFYEHGPLLVEVHVVDYDQDLYDQNLDVAFLARLRGEATFDDVAALVAQIGRDVIETGEIFKKFSPESSVLLE